MESSELIIVIRYYTNTNNNVELWNVEIMVKNVLSAEEKKSSTKNAKFLKTMNRAIKFSKDAYF